MNGFCNLSRKEYRVSFIRVKSVTPFGYPFMYCRKVRIKESKRHGWGFHYNIKTCVISKESYRRVNSIDEQYR